MSLYLMTVNFHIKASSIHEAELMVFDQIKSKKKDDEFGIIGLNHFRPLELKY